MSPTTDIEKQQNNRTQKPESFLFSVIYGMSASMAKIYITAVAATTGVAMWLLGLLGAVDADLTEYGILGLFILYMSKDLVPWLMKKLDQKVVEDASSIHVELAVLKKDLEYQKQKIDDLKADNLVSHEKIMVAVEALRDER